MVNATIVGLDLVGKGKVFRISTCECICGEVECSLWLNYVDIYQIHWSAHFVPIDDISQVMDDLPNSAKTFVFSVGIFTPEQKDVFRKLAQFIL